MAMNQDRLYRVIEALERVPEETKKMVIDSALSMTDIEIIKCFNQQGSDLFNLVDEITRSIGKEKEYNISGYKLIFESALKINAKLPIDKFTLLILEYAPEIYAEKEDCFLGMSIPDATINVNNEFGLIRSEMFKTLWKTIGKRDQERLKENVIPLTLYAHIYLYKTVMSTK